MVVEKGQAVVKGRSAKLVCPFCGREFPRWYWYVPYCVGALGTRKNKGLAYANFRRHKEACEKRKNA